MKRLILILLAVCAAAFSVAVGSDDPASRLQRQADAMASEAARELELSDPDRQTLCRLFFEKLSNEEQRMRHVDDPAVRSQIVKQTHREFTDKLHAAYNRETSNRIEGWYYNYTNKNKPTEL